MIDPTIARCRSELIHDGKRYFLAYGLLALEPIFLVPLLAHLLTARQLGILGAIEGVNAVLCGISQLGVKFAYLQYVADHGQHNRGRGLWTATALVAIAGMLFGIIATILLNTLWLIPQFTTTEALQPWTLALLLLLTNVQMMLITDLRAKRHPMPFVFTSMLRLITMLALLYFVVPHLGHAVDGVLLAQAVALLASIALLLRIAERPPLAKFDRKLAREFIEYGWPIAVGSLIKYGTDALLPWLCLTLVSPAAAGAMALANKTANLFDNGFGLPFLMAWGGRIYEWLKDNTLHRLLPRLILEIAIAGLSATLLAWLVGIFILQASHSEAATLAVTLLPLALAGKLFFMLRSPASAGYLATRNMRWQIRYALLALVLAATLGSLAFGTLGTAVGWGVFVAVEALVVILMFVRGGALLRTSASVLKVT